VSAINVMVQLSMSSFGIGRQMVPVASQFASVPAGQSVSLNFPTPPNFIGEGAEPWLGASVNLQHPYDQDLANNQAASMWMGIDIDTAAEPGGVLSPTFPVANEFSTATEEITLSIIPTAGVTVSNLPGPISLNPGQVQNAGFDLVQAPAMDGGTFLVPLASVVGIDSNGNFVGGLTIVGAVND